MHLCSLHEPLEASQGLLPAFCIDTFSLKRNEESTRDDFFKLQTLVCSSNGDKVSKGVTALEASKRAWLDSFTDICDVETYF